MKYFLTGGTSGTPKIVSHSNLEWREIIDDTALVVEELGVSPNARVLIGQPSFPWSVGQVFADACDLIGATTFCFGLSAAHEAITRQVEQMSLTHLTLPQGLLLNWAERGWPIPKGVDLWIVGEGLSLENQRRLEDRWQPRSIRRIFGCSEFGTLAYQASEDTLWLRTNPKFSFRLENTTSLREGRLYIRRFSGDVELNTGDYASMREVVDQTGGLWATSPQILFRRRASASMTLSDGSVISGEVLDSLKEEFGLSEIQIVRSVTDLGDKLSVHCASLNSLDLAEIKAGLFRHVPELDLETANEATWNLVSVEVKSLNLGSFAKTERGKIPMFVNEN